MNEELELNNYILCGVCQNSFEYFENSSCYICRMFICEECADNSYEIEGNQFVCKYCFEHYSKYIKKDKYKHSCFECYRNLNFFQARNNALQKITDEEFIKLWISPHIQFLCCSCYDDYESKYNKITRKYYYHHDESGFYASEIYATNKKNAIKSYIKEFNLKKLPNGFEIWS